MACRLIGSYGDHKALIASRASHVAPPFEPDPIFAAIEAHRKAHADWIKALRRFDETEETPPEARIYLGEVNDVECVKNPDETMTIRRTGKTEAVYARCEEHIKDFPTKSWSDAVRNAWIQKKRAELHTETQRLNEQFAQTPAGRLWVASEDLADKHNAVEAKLFDTTATTLAGLLALLTYLRTNDYLSETISEEQKGSELAALFDRSLCKIADLPEPPPWFDNEETQEA
jgi:hypothetical protein